MTTTTRHARFVSSTVTVMRRTGRDGRRRWMPTRAADAADGAADDALERLREKISKIPSPAELRKALEEAGRIVEDDDLGTDDSAKVSLHAVGPIIVGVAAAAASLYLANFVRMNIKSGLGMGKILVSVVFNDFCASLAVSVLLLYTGAAGRLAEVALNSTADFVRPKHVNSLWWISLFLKRSVVYVQRLIRITLLWNLGNQIWSLIPLGVDLVAFDPIESEGANHLHSLCCTVFDANKDGIVTTTEVQMWFVSKTLRLLRFFSFLEIFKWFMHLKSPPNIEEQRSRGHVYDREDFVSQALRHHYAGLRGTRGVSWEQQARSALIDKTLSVAAYLAVIYWCLTALGVNLTGILAVGGVSGIAVGFAAQKLVSNCIGGILIFVTQPFVEGDHVAFGSIEGRVEMVGWHSTRISSLEDGFSFIVPNTDVLGSALRNLSRREYIPIKIKVPFPEAIKSRKGMATFVEEIRSLVMDTVDAYSVRTPTVDMKFDDLKPHISIKAFINGSKDKNRAADLRTKLMLEIQEKCDDSTRTSFSSSDE